MHQRYVQELSLQYDLEQQKKQLENYSLQLESMVQERTKELHKSEQWHRSLFENATDGIIVLDQKGLIVNANDKACKMHGFDKGSLIGTHIKLLEREGNMQLMIERMHRIMSGESLVFEGIHNKKDGSPMHLEISSKSITIGEETFVQSFYRDITEKKKLQEHLLQSQKMDSIGLLAGGIAHDFNNMLTAILGHTEIARSSDGLNARAIRSLDIIEDASRKAGRMISKLLGFARKSNYEFLPVNINDVVYDSIKLIERVVEKTHELALELDNRLPFIHADINQIEQVIMNLVVNARDAMPKGGRISITTTFREVKKDMPDVPPYVPPGDYVQLRVSDTGIGIPAQIRDSIFEPFFTTKERGKGTGLGLAMVYGVVNDHKGYIALQSEVGAGTVFSLYFPVAHVTAAPLTKKMSATSLRGTETLLVVDDEKDILDAMRDILAAHGYTVFAANDGAMALDLFREKSQEIALVITDIVMPRVDGRELIKNIKALNPKIKILAVSGYTKYVAEKEEIKDIDGFLQKPFESPYLLSTIRRILDNARAQKDTLVC